MQGSRTSMLFYQKIEEIQGDAYTNSISKTLLRATVNAS